MVTKNKLNYDKLFMTSFFAVLIIATIIVFVSNNTSMNLIFIWASIICAWLYFKSY
jgi:hypothetical protein